MSGYYTNLRLGSNGNLVIEPTQNALDEKERFLDMPTHEALAELLEDHLCNGLDWIQPEEILAMTESPILSDEAVYSDDGELVSIGRVWWFPGYMVTSEVEEILNNGGVVFLSDSNS